MFKLSKKWINRVSPVMGSQECQEVFFFFSCNFRHEKVMNVFYVVYYMTTYIIVMQFL